MHLGCNFLGFGRTILFFLEEATKEGGAKKNGTLNKTLPEQGKEKFNNIFYELKTQ